jgi:alginate O-acetyltransferase complex protein AlgI
MLFNSFVFLFFFLWVLVVHHSPISWTLKKMHLLAMSYLFYAAWNPPFVLLLLISTFWDWNIAEKIHRSETQKKRRLWLSLSLTLNLGLLVVFKYSSFLIENFNHLIAFTGVQWTLTDPGLILPMGISFYTFQTLSYTLDVYFKRLKPWHSFNDYALFVSFFPQLVAGPIVRAKDFLPQTQNQTKTSSSVFSVGVSLFIIGLFQKMVLADAFFAPIVDQVFSSSQSLDSSSAWIGGVLFSAQIFCDFSGYSLCAIGVAMCLGFRLPINFKSPFAAIGFSDFWRRWHISLSSWLRDYLYIPLGGNRSGRFKTFRNLSLTMLLGGLWHGAAWTFIVWGGLHGLYLIVERLLKSHWRWKLHNNIFAQWFLSLLTFFFIMLAFVVFRADSFQQAIDIILAMFSGTQTQSLIAWDWWTQIVLFTFLALLLVQWALRHKTPTDVITNMPWILRSMILYACLILIVISSGGSDAFIYFQF